MIIITFSGCRTSPPSISAIKSSYLEPVVAEVDGQPIYQREFLDFIYNPISRSILDEIILTRIVKQEAQVRGISAGPELIQAEYEHTLSMLAPDKPRYQQEAIFNYMLSRRGFERNTFDLILHRQALLKKMIDPNIVITEKMIKNEYEIQYGRKVVVRQLVASSFRLINQARQRLKNGEDFTAIVMDLSEDQLSLANNGQVGPFSQADIDIPQLVRQTAFLLKNEGDFSEPFSVYDDNQKEMWYWIQLLRIYPAESVPFNQVCTELTDIIRNKEIRQRVAVLQNELKDKAKIKIMDGRLLLTKEKPLLP